MRRLALTCFLAASLATPAWGLSKTVRASGYDLLVSYPTGVAVIDPNQTDDWGLIPMSGNVEAAAHLRDRDVLLLHAPNVGELSVVDLQPFSPSRYQVLASYRSPELGRRGMRFVRSGTRVYLASGRTAVAILDPQTLLAKLGLYTFDFLPLVYATGDQSILSQGIFTLKDGQLTYEDPRPKGGISAPVYVRLSQRPIEMLTDTVSSKLYLSASKPDGTGVVFVVDATTRTVAQEIPVPWPITSMAWLDNGELALLSGPRRRLAIYDTKLNRWARVWSPQIPGMPSRLLPVGKPPEVAPPPLEEEP